MFVEGLESMDFKEAEEHLLKKWEQIVSWRARYTGQSDAMMRFGSNEFVARDVFEGTIEFLRLNRTVRYREIRKEQVQHAETSKILAPVSTTEIFSNGRTYHSNSSAPGGEGHNTGKTDLVKSGTLLAIPSKVHLECLKRSKESIKCRGREGDRIVFECGGQPERSFTWKDRGIVIDAVREVRYYDYETGVLVREESLSESGKCDGWTDYVTEEIELVSTPS